MAKLLLALAVVLVIPILPAYAQGMIQPASGGSLDVMLEPQWEQDGQARFKVTFLQPGTQTVQVHIDYDLVVKDQRGSEVFRATDQFPGQPVLHTESGIVTIPQVPSSYKFEENGSYTVAVEMFGIQFIPINPETAEFSINVTPEFPAGTLAIFAAMAGTIVAVRLKKL